MRHTPDESEVAKYPVPAVAAGQRIRELGVMPGAQDRAGAAVDDRLRHLGAIRLGAREVADLPAVSPLEHDRVHAGALGSLGLHGAGLVRRRDRLPAAQGKPGGRAGERRRALERRWKLAAERRLVGEVLRRGRLRRRRDRQRQGAQNRDQQVR